jgi:hypothetical protein
MEGNEIEKAAIAHVTDMYGGFIRLELIDIVRVESFTAGANWQKERDEPLRKEVERLNEDLKKAQILLGKRSTEYELEIETLVAVAASDPTICGKLYSIIQQLQSENERLKEAMDEILYPVKYMQKRAKESGGELNGVCAVMLSENHSYLKEIARKALHPVKNP